MKFGGELDDQVIVERVVKGQSDLFRFLIERHQKAVYGLGLSFFRNAEEAADFVQEVFLKTFRNLASFQGRSRFSTWLYKIAYNTALNSVKRNKEYQSLAEDMDIPDPDTPERQSIRSAACQAVQEAMDELPGKYRICMDLYFFYDRSYQEIEAVTGFPVNTIKSHVFRAKKLLKKKLGDIAEGGFE